ncbi:MAG TPA: hypothetical protein VKG44_09910 [Candidatus Baltobacteraceae bacterium]|nr:hypothetical protein [Candidatus Baltobacteraceae bacterium]
MVPRDVSGAAPWALSALPECFRQLSEAHGTLAFVRRRLPAEAQPVVDDVGLVSADCRLHIYADAAMVERGSQTLFVPPDTHFYTWGDHLAFVRRDGSKAELRVYQRADGAPIALRLERDERNGPNAVACRKNVRKC